MARACKIKYTVYARRNDLEKWSDWSNLDDLDVVSQHVATITGYGWQAKVVNRATGSEDYYGV